MATKKPAAKKPAAKKPAAKKPVSTKAVTAKKAEPTPKQPKAAPKVLPSAKGAQPGDIIQALVVQRNKATDALAMTEANFAAFKRQHSDCTPKAAEPEIPAEPPADA